MDRCSATLGPRGHVTSTGPCASKMGLGRRGPYIAPPMFPCTCRFRLCRTWGQHGRSTGVAVASLEEARFGLGSFHWVEHQCSS